MNDRLKRLLEQAQVSPVHKRYVRRAFESEFEAVVDKFLVASKNDPAVLSVTGLTGTGKTSLIQSLLWRRSDIIGYHFHRVLFLSDQNTDPCKVQNMAMNVLFHFWKEIPDGKTLEWFQNGSQLLLKRVINEMGRVLIILDGVYLKEVVDLFRDLRCSLIITTNRKDLTNHIDSVFCYHLTLEHSSIDDLVHLSEVYGFRDISRHYASSLLIITGGNFGLLEKLYTAAKGNMDRLKFLVNQLRLGVSKDLSCMSYYPHRSLATPIDILSLFLRKTVSAQMVSLSLLQMGIWIRIEILSKLWSVDIVDSVKDQFYQMISLDMSHLAEFSLIDNSLADNEIRIPPLFRLYLLGKAVPTHLTIYNKFTHRLRTDQTDAKQHCEEYLINQLVDSIDIDAALKRTCGKCSDFTSKSEGHSIIGYVYEFFNYLFRR